MVQYLGSHFFRNVFDRGKEHYKIFNGLIPKHRVGTFVNQDLDPYLHRLYLGVDAAPYLQECRLFNGAGGNDCKPARYERVHAKEPWKDIVLEDVACLVRHLRETKQINIHVVDVVIPTYRLHQEYLERLCSLKVPPSWRTTFIVIVDNPHLLLAQYRDKAAAPNSTTEALLRQAEAVLEEQLRSASQDALGDHGNNVRVRANQVNSGASASRNKGIFESSAEYILFFDDDVIPNEDVLFKYNEQMEYCLKHHCNGKKDKLLGLIGTVQFPRSPVTQAGCCNENGIVTIPSDNTANKVLPILHAGVLMSYLTFSFEIARNPMYMTPAWGVTASILVKRRSTLLFDESYAKTGGGEDVDFCLRLAKAYPNAKLYSAKDAVVYHLFWKGGFFALASHFCQWAKGDSGLFPRFPEHCFWSVPNVSEMTFLTMLTFSLCSFGYQAFLFPLTFWDVMWMDGVGGVWTIASWDMDFLLGIFKCGVTVLTKTFLAFVGYCLWDVCVDMMDRDGLKHRTKQLIPPKVLDEIENNNDQHDTTSVVQSKNIPQANVSFIYILQAHILANLYIILLEFGQLWGHLKRGRFLYIGKRFDWHIGRLPNYRQTFLVMEVKKLSGFIVVFTWLLLVW